MWLSRQHPSQQDHGPFYASDATLSFTTNREEPTRTSNVACLLHDALDLAPEVGTVYPRLNETTMPADTDK